MKNLAWSGRLRLGVAGIALLVAAIGAFAQVPQDVRACGPAPLGAWCADGPWSRFSRMDFTITTGNFSADYVVRFPAGRDVYAKYDEKSGPRRRKGEILVVDDRVIAFKTSDARDENRAIDTQMLASPLMMSQLVAVLLQTGVPGGEKAMAPARQVAMQEAARFILTSVPDAAALYGPPWSVTGNVRRPSPGKVTFSLRFRFTPVDQVGAIINDRAESIVLSGSALYADKREALPDSFSLAGWQLEKSGADLPELPTLGAMRALLRTE